MTESPQSIFSADHEKILETIIYIASTEKEPMHYRKIAYLIYFADKTHLEKYARTITGDDYIAIYQGIVPAHVYVNLLNSKYNVNNPNFHISYNGIIVDRVVDLNEFSESDIEILDNTIQVYSKFPLWQLQEFARDSIWRKIWVEGDKKKAINVDMLDVIQSVDDENSLLNYLTRDTDDSLDEYVISDSKIY